MNVLRLRVPPSTQVIVVGNVWRYGVFCSEALAIGMRNLRKIDIIKMISQPPPPTDNHSQGVLLYNICTLVYMVDLVCYTHHLTPVIRNAGDHFMLKDKMINYMGFGLYFASIGRVMCKNTPNSD